MVYIKQNEQVFSVRRKIALRPPEFDACREASEVNRNFLSAATLHHDHHNYLLPFFPSPFFGSVFFAATFTRRSSSFNTADFAAAIVSRFTCSVIRPLVKSSNSM